MTILIGFSTKENIVFGSDSQSSSPSSTAKQLDIKKISHVRFADGAIALVAKAGGLDSADYFLELFETKAAATPIAHRRSIADLAESCLKDVQTKLLEPLRSRSAPNDEINQFLRDYFCELLIGYFHEGKPSIYKMRSDSCLAVKDNHAFVALGCAAGLATSVLSGFNLYDTKFIQSIGVAGYAVEFCKLNDWACSGRTQIAAIFPPEKGGRPEAFFAESNISEIVESTAEEVQVKMQDVLRASALDGMMTRLSKQYHETQEQKKITAP